MKGQADKKASSQTFRIYIFRKGISSRIVDHKKSETKNTIRHHVICLLENDHIKDQSWNLFLQLVKSLSFLRMIYYITRRESMKKRAIPKIKLNILHYDACNPIIMV